MIHKFAFLDVVDAWVRDAIRPELPFSSPRQRIPRSSAMIVRRMTEAALYDAPGGGKLVGAGLDVFATEPAESASPLLRLDQVVVTPHTAGSAIDLVATSRATPSPPCSPCCAAHRTRG